MYVENNIFFEVFSWMEKVEQYYDIFYLIQVRYLLGIKFKKQHLKNWLKNLMSERFEPFKNDILPFVMKLYDILENPRFDKFISWANHGTEVEIKNPKKLEAHVLPHYFRHRNVLSFTRQLNMHEFKKLNKSGCERNHVFYANQNFKQHDIPQLRLIRTNKKKKRKNSQLSKDTVQFQQREDSEFSGFQNTAKSKFQEIQGILSRIALNHPKMSMEISSIIQQCQKGTKIETSEKLNSLNSLSFIGQERNSFLEKSIDQNLDIECMRQPSFYSLGEL